MRTSRLEVAAMQLASRPRALMGRDHELKQARKIAFGLLD